MSRAGTTDSAEGKSVVDSEGNRIGLVAGVQNGTACVEPEPGLADSVLSKLRWERVDTDDYPLAESEMQTVTNDETKLE